MQVLNIISSGRIRCGALSSHFGGNAYTYDKITQICVIGQTPKIFEVQSAGMTVFVDRSLPVGNPSVYDPGLYYTFKIMFRLVLV